MPIALQHSLWNLWLFAIPLVAFIVTTWWGFLEDVPQISLGTLWGSALSIVCLFYVAYSYRRDRAWRRPQNQLIFYRALADLLLSMRLFFFPLYHCVAFACTTELTLQTCQASALVYHFCWVASESWMVAIALECHGLLSNPFRDSKRHVKIYSAFIWIFAVV